MRSLFVFCMFLACSFACKAQTDLALLNVYPLDHITPGTYSFMPTAQNMGTSGVATYMVYWQVDNGTISSAVPVSPPSFGAGPGVAVELVSPSFSATFSTTGNHILKVWIKATSSADVNHTNDTITKTVKVYSYLPPKNVVLEVYKHQTCSPCYPAAEYEDSVVAKMSNYSIVNVYPYNVDIFYTQEGEYFQDSFGFGHPAPLFDRFQFPYNLTLESDFYTLGTGYYLRYLGDRDKDFQPVAVSFNEVSFDPVSMLLKVKLQAQFYDTLQGDMRFNLFITEDSLQGYQAAAPTPNNYYHMHVLRKMTGGTWGVQGSLPSVVHTGDIVQYEFQYTIPSTWNLNNLTLTGMVQIYNNDKFQRDILNSCKASFSEALSITKETIGFNASIYPNPCTSTVNISLSGSAANNDMPMYITDMNGKLIKQALINKNNMRLDVNELIQGNYIIKVISKEGVYLGKFVKLQDQ